MCFAGLVVIARSPHPIPSRTRPLNSSAPMVLRLKAWKSRSLPGLPSTCAITGHLSSSDANARSAFACSLRVWLAHRLFQSAAPFSTLRGCADDWWRGRDASPARCRRRSREDGQGKIPGPQWPGILARGGACPARPQRTQVMRGRAKKDTGLAIAWIIGAGWSSPVARQAHNLKVAGSNPAPATKFPKEYSRLRASRTVGL